MSESKDKPKYSIRKRSTNYLGIYDGEHCLCAICVKRPRGALDAQLILEALEEYAGKESTKPEPAPAK